MALNNQELDKLLQTDITYLSTCDLEGNPHVKPIWFVVDHGNIWFEMDLNTRAFRNIKENNQVMLCFGGRATYLVWGIVNWYKESECPIQIRKMFKDKYKELMNDGFITDLTRIFEVQIHKYKSWHGPEKAWEGLDL